MENGNNVGGRKKGGRSPKTLNRLRSKIKSILVGLQKEGIADISKVKGEQINEYFKKWNKAGHTLDYATRFQAFWNWWIKYNRKKGKLIPDICMELEKGKKNSTNFVYIEKEDFDKFRKYFNEEKQLLLMFCFDSIIRSPGELSGLKVENIKLEKNGEVWVNIPEEISKTFGRKFNLVFCGEQIMQYIKNKKPEDPLFVFSSPMLNEEMQKIAKQIFGERKSEGGEYFKNITLYDLRHSGAIYFRKVFQKTGQSLDSLRHRGGWTDFNMVNYYTRFLGLTGHVDKEKTLLQEDKSEIEKEFVRLKKTSSNLNQNMNSFQEGVIKFLNKIYNNEKPTKEDLDSLKLLINQNIKIQKQHE
jgi:integrase